MGISDDGAEVVAWILGPVQHISGNLLNLAVFAMVTLMAKSMPFITKPVFHTFIASAAKEQFQEEWEMIPVAGSKIHCFFIA